MEYREQIALGGIPGAGKTSVGKLVAEKLGYKFWSMGLLRRKLAMEKYEITINQLNELEKIKLALIDDYGERILKDTTKRAAALEEAIESHDLTKRKVKILEDLFLHDSDKQVDDLQKELAKNKEKIILEGRLAYFFCPDAVSFYLQCDLKVASRRIHDAKRDTEKPYRDADEALKDIKQRIDDDRERYRVKYRGQKNSRGKDTNCYNKDNFDFVINTSKKDIDDVVKELIGTYQRAIESSVKRASVTR